MRMAAFLCSFVLVGCASTLSITYRSEPPGAMIAQGQKAFGYAPTVVSYAPSEAFKKGSCMEVLPIQAQWISGASTVPKIMTFCPSQGYNQYVVFMRPAGLAGRDLDVKWAIHLEDAAIAQQQADAAAWAAAFAGSQAVQPQSVHCVTSQVGTAIMTNCN